MIEKKAYLDQYTLPAFNFYESEKNIKLMLFPECRHIELTETETNLLLNLRAKISEWGSKEVDLDAFNDFYFKITKLYNLESRLHNIKVIVKTLEPFKGTFLKQTMDQENIDKLKSLCGEVSVPYQFKTDKLIEALNKALKFVTNDIGRVHLSLKGDDIEYNFLREYSKISVSLSINRGSTEITYAEWINFYKLAIEKAEKNEQQSRD